MVFSLKSIPNSINYVKSISLFPVLYLDHYPPIIGTQAILVQHTEEHATENPCDLMPHTSRLAPTVQQRTQSDP